VFPRPASSPVLITTAGIPSVLGPRPPASICSYPKDMQGFKMLESMVTKDWGVENQTVWKKYDVTFTAPSNKVRPAWAFVKPASAQARGAPARWPQGPSTPRQ
jgi:hypothetical protein